MKRTDASEPVLNFSNFRPKKNYYICWGYVFLYLSLCMLVIEAKSGKM